MWSFSKYYARVKCISCGANTKEFQDSDNIKVESQAVSAWNCRADGWIPECLEPLDESDYIIHRVVDDDINDEPYSVVEAAYWKRGCWHDIADGWTLRDVTHWQIMPKAPEGD